MAPFTLAVNSGSFCPYTLPVSIALTITAFGVTYNVYSHVAVT